MCDYQPGVGVCYSAAPVAYLGAPRVLWCVCPYLLLGIACLSLTCSFSLKWRPWLQLFTPMSYNFYCVKLVLN